MAEMVNGKKKTIFRMFLLPLAAVMLVQAAVACGTVYLGGMSKRLNDYSVGIMSQIVKNRGLILENNMLHQWSDIYGEYQIADSYLTDMMAEKGMDEKAFLKDEDAKREFLGQLLDPSLTMLRRNGVNGVYIVLADQEVKSLPLAGSASGDGEKQVQQRSGIYFRDADPDIDPKDYSDLLMERGNVEFAHELKMGLDTEWSTKFSFQSGENGIADSFFYKPYLAAVGNPGARAEDLAYWGENFHMEGEENYRMITYSTPLISENGVVYGVMGVEISADSLTKLMPESELNDGRGSGYVMAQYSEGRLTPFCVSGSAVQNLVLEDVFMEMKDTRYDHLYQLEDPDGNKSGFYANVVPINQYRANTPFEDNGWAIIGVQESQSLFGMGSRMMRKVLFAVFCSLIFGIVSVYFLITHLTKPIRDLAAWIRNARRNEVKEFEETDIAEIKDLYDAVCDMSERQKRAEYKALEEKERYLLALQSSTDLIFTYNVEDDSMDIYDLTEEGKRWENERHETQALEKIQQSRDIRDVDRQLMQKMFLRLDDEFKLRFRACTRQKGWQWMELSAKTIANEDGTKIKVVGSINNIHEQKLQEQMETKAARIDPVTGLFRGEIGLRIVRSELETGRSGHLLLMDLDKFKEMNDQFGIDFGDAVLEEIGIFILRLEREKEKNGKRVTAVRAGGDEILVWLKNYGRDDSEAFYKRFIKMVRRLSQDSDFELSFTSCCICADGIDFDVVIGLLRSAMYYCKKRRAGKFTFCDAIPDQELFLNGIGKRDFNEVVSYGNPRAINLVTKVFNMFERGGRVSPILSVLFARMGETYRLRDIWLTEIRHDFYTSSVTKQWHSEEESADKREIVHFKESDLAECEEKLSGGYTSIGERDGFTVGGKRLLHIPEETEGLVIPMYDSGRLSGAVIFVYRTGQRRWEEGTCTQLQEIVKIMETNINREKYDLASRAKSDFLSRMSHEIRTPMNAITGMTAIALKNKEDPAQLEGCLKKIDQSSKYLLGLINDILDMSKIESGKMKLLRTAGSLRALSDEIDDLMGQQLKEKKITYVKNFDVAHDWVEADFLRLKQVLINMMSNSAKFTPEGGCVTLTIREQEAGFMSGCVQEGKKESYYFSVEDNGIGISSVNQVRIFSAFEQAEDSITSLYGGTGLGLSISSRLVRMMGGEISLESEENQGSRFSFVLELKKVRAREKKEKKEDFQDNPDYTGYRVLLVEDNELNTEIAKTLLEMYGFSVETAENGQISVEKFSKNGAGYYDLILMDIRMPVMDGLEATKAIRNLERRDAATVPIIAMTANAFDDDMKKSIESGMNGHLPKPVDVRELLLTVERVMKKKNADSGDKTAKREESPSS